MIMDKKDEKKAHNDFPTNDQDMVKPDAAGSASSDKLEDAEKTLYLIDENGNIIQVIDDFLPWGVNPFEDFITEYGPCIDPEIDPTISIDDIEQPCIYGPPPCDDNEIDEGLDFDDTLL